MEALTAGPAGPEVSEEYGGGGAFGAGRQLGPQLNANRSVSSQILRGGQLTGLQDTVRLVVDDINNSLIIQATSVDYAYLSDTIKKMDVLPRQALIDAKLFEVDLENDKSYGLNSSSRRRGPPPPLTTGAINGGTLSAQTYLPIGDAREFLAALTAVGSRTKVKVLEAPSVLALDGQTASIMVGSQIPYPGGSFTSSAGGSTTSVEYRDTGINLQVIPHISASGSVTLDLVQEVSAPGADVSIGGNSAPTFTVTSVSTTLTVKDGETVAIAGLIRDGDNTSRTGIPFLSQIPLLGSLFGQTTKNSHRNELIILITPHVIRTPEKLQEMTQGLRDSLRNVGQYAESEGQREGGGCRQGPGEQKSPGNKRTKKYQPAESGSGEGGKTQ